MDKYSLISISTVLVLALFLTFSGVQNVESDYDYTGLVSDINKSAKGYTFNLITDENTIKCFYEQKPDETFYSLKGEFSDDGNIFFVSSMEKVQ